MIIPGLPVFQLLGEGVYRGQALFSYSGSTSEETSWQVPFGVETISVVCVGMGGDGTDYDSGTSTLGTSGAGGDLRYVNDIPVTPGETLTVRIAKGGAGDATNGAALLRGSTVLARAVSAVGKLPGDQAYNVGQGGRGGRGYDDTEAANFAAGGGGAGGYSGSGGNGGHGSPVGLFNEYTSSAQPGLGGAGAGGAVEDGNEGHPNNGSGGGGGVGPTGEGLSGNSYGEGGSSGNPGNVGSSGDGGRFGGGGGAGGDLHRATGGTGGPGGVRIIWGEGRSFPNNAGDV